MRLACEDVIEAKRALPSSLSSVPRRRGFTPLRPPQASEASTCRKKWAPLEALSNTRASALTAEVAQESHGVEARWPTPGPAAAPRLRLAQRPIPECSPQETAVPREGSLCRAGFRLRGRRAG